MSASRVGEVCNRKKRADGDHEHCLALCDQQESLHEIPTVEDLFEAGLKRHQHEGDHNEGHELPARPLERHLHIENVPLHKKHSARDIMNPTAIATKYRLMSNHARPVTT